MIALLALLIVIAAFGVTAAWMADNPGSVVIHWFDYEIDTSFAFLVLLALIAACTIAFFAGMFNRLILIPERILQARQLKYYRYGMIEITHSVAALAAGEIDSAETHTRKAQKLLGGTPLVLLLSAQIARSRGDDAKTREVLDQMLGYKETEYLAARSLSDSASRQQLFSKALVLAQRAHAVNSKGFAPVVSLHARLGEWQEALVALNQAVKSGQLTLSARRRYRGIIHLLQGMHALDHHQPEIAMAMAKTTLKEVPNFTPAMRFAVQAFAANGKRKKADKLQAALAKLPPNHWSCSACGEAAEIWAAHCPACGAFDTLK